MNRVNPSGPLSGKRTAPGAGGLCFTCCRPPDNPVKLSTGSGESLTFCRACFFKLLGAGRRRGRPVTKRPAAAAVGARAQAGCAAGAT